MDEWIDRLADDLGEEPMNRGEVGQVLKLAREVAHGVERKAAPLAAFIAGVHVGRRTAQGGARSEALEDSLRSAAALLPAETSEEPAGSASPGAE